MCHICFCCLRVTNNSLLDCVLDSSSKFHLTKQIIDFGDQTCTGDKKLQPSPPLLSYSPISTTQHAPRFYLKN